MKENYKEQLLVKWQHSLKKVLWRQQSKSQLSSYLTSLDCTLHVCPHLVFNSKQGLTAQDLKKYCFHNLKTCLHIMIRNRFSWSLIMMLEKQQLLQLRRILMMMVVYLQEQHISYGGRYVSFEVNSLRDISTMSYMAHTLKVKFQDL